ncbi:hypothetical protein [Flavobacterium aciduliphilum]|uniref:Uncharacterized protein n=1 Tax=Flavobacterium aciduliphilum TaxID=1101402 RepID=A0A328YBP5_9FLAO|nr:hypothetical protein [Flavobacterium aciduliphilum]RAR71461.1 hypothetical protein CLV55_10716 [Flavobacterium aciduliphilum]
MAQNKLDTQIKEQIDRREIQPSNSSWDRLDAMLTIAEQKKPKRFDFHSFQSLGIAASILVLVALGLFLFNQKENVVKPENNLVVKGNNYKNTNENTKTHEIDSVKIFDIDSKQQNQQVVEINNQKVTSSHQRQSKKFNQNKPNLLINQENQIEFQNKESVAQKVPSTVEPQKARISNSLNEDNVLVSIEKTAKPNTKVKVNANSLLSKVDGELDQSFREKVLTKISKNYQEVKGALAARNQE